MAKKIAIGKIAHDKLLEGAFLMYQMVGATLSPKGRNIGLQMPWGNDVIVHDGVTVAREVESEDELVQMGITYIKQAAEKTVSEVGDATTTTTILAYEIIKRGFELIDSEQKINGMVLRKQLQAALPTLLEGVKKITKHIKDQEDIERVASISAADKELGKMIGEAVHKVGQDGIVSVDNSVTTQTQLEYTRGMQFDRGWQSTSYMFINNPARMEAVIRDPYILVLGKKITSMPEIVPVVKTIKAINSTCPVVVVGEIGGMALEFLVVNKKQGNLEGVAIDVPGFDERKRNMLLDIAYYTGATYITDQVGIEEKPFEAIWLGRAKTVIVSQNQTSIIEGKGDKIELEKHITILKEQLANAKTLFEKEILQERIAKLTTGAAIIRVGGKTEVEQRDRLERVKDAVGAAKAAVKEGIVPGGGLAFLRIRENLPMKAKRNEGEQILFTILASIIYKILENAGMSQEEADQIIAQITDKKDNIGYNVVTDTLEDLEKTGVIDPSMAIRLALENAISVGAAILTCEGLIGKAKEKDPNLQMA